MILRFEKEILNRVSAKRKKMIIYMVVDWDMNNMGKWRKNHHEKCRLI